MNINRSKITLAELERARHSGLLVDLRKKKVVATNKIEAKKETSGFSLFSKNTKQKIKEKENFLEAVKENLSKKNFVPEKKERKEIIKNVVETLKPKKKKKKLDLVSIFSFSWKPKDSKKWLKVVKEKQKIFDSRFRHGKRLKIAEQKVVWYRSLFSFALILLFLVVPLKLLSYFQILDVKELETRIMTHSNAALSSLNSAAESVSELDFQGADQDFSQAGEEFVRAQSELKLINNSLLSLISLSNNPKIKLASESKNILEAGTLGSSMGKNLVLATAKLFNYEGEDKVMLGLKDFSHYGALAYQDALKLIAVLNKIDEKNMPLEYQAQFSDLKNKATFISASLGEIVEMSDKAFSLLGLSQDKRYLLIFQNNAELRASGGFLGSYALLDVRDGKIKNLEVPAGGSYDTEGGMTVTVKAPEPLWLVNPSWHFWDANWWPDWPKTAKNLMWFYEKSGGSTVDGVITFTPSVLEDLLRVTGPIDMTQEYGVIIDADNFWEITQKIVEHDNIILTHPEEVIDFDKNLTSIESDIPLKQDLENNTENKPKKIIGDLMARVLEVLPQSLNEDSLVKVIQLFEKNISQKQIMVYFESEELQAEVEARNIAGQVKQSPHDYLMVVNTNIAGQKTDRKMKEDIEHLSQVSSKGKIINSLKINRYHEGLKNEVFSGVRNVNWLRIYLPLGSRLISASGFSVPDASYFEKPEQDWLDSEFLQEERLAVTDPMTGLKIYQENGKTVFAGWVMTDPGQMSDIRVSYELPFNFYEEQKAETDIWKRLDNLVNSEKIDYSKYSLLIQKQPGSKASQISSRLILADESELVWHHPENLKWDSGWDIKDIIDRDKYYSILINDTYEQR